jgi:hypothetical protein
MVEYVLKCASIECCDDVAPLLPNSPELFRSPENPGRPCFSLIRYPLLLLYIYILIYLSSFSHA